MEKVYESSRNKNNTVTAKEAILKGISEDGGLFVLPGLKDIQIDMDTILKQNYQENAVYILSKLLPDYTLDELKECVKNAYETNFASKEVTPLRKVGDIYVLELFQGPTSAFKDVALTLLPQLMKTALAKTNQKAMILTATSGDTGKAALSGFQDVDNIGIAVFYPDQKVSQIQYRQMASQPGKNVKVFAIKGNFDDAQSTVKKLFLDESMQDYCRKNNVLLTSANSINVGRLVPQIVYYFEAYKQLVDQKAIKAGDKVSFSVPTGNFGDVLAGYYAYLMGLPVKKFYVASNANKVLTDFLTTGVYDRNRDFIQTISPSMDILISSNLERLLYYMSDNDNEQIKKWMNELNETGSYKISEEMLKKIQELFGAGYVDDDQCRQVIKEVYEKTGVVLDPHTAIGYEVAKENKKEDEVIVSLATASPYKFAMDVMKAIDGKDYGEWEAMDALSSSFEDPIPDGLNSLKDMPILHKDVIEIADMKDEVLKAMEQVL